MGEYKAWVERDLPANGWKIWIYRRMPPNALGEDQIEVIYPTKSYRMECKAVVAQTTDVPCEASLLIPYGAGEPLLEALASAVKPLTPREDPYVKCLLERIADLKAHVKDLELACGMDPRAMKQLAKDILRAKPDIVLGPDEEPPPGSIAVHLHKEKLNA